MLFATILECISTGRSVFWYIYHRKDRCDRYDQ